MRLLGVKEKLKLFKTDFKKWNYDVFGCMNTTKQCIIKEIEELDHKDDDF